MKKIHVIVIKNKVFFHIIILGTKDSKDSVFFLLVFKKKENKTLNTGQYELNEHVEKFY